jgi:hypothetical protein
MSWADLLAWSDGHGLLGKRLYVVLSEPVTGLQAVLDNLDAHDRVTLCLRVLANRASGGPRFLGDRTARVSRCGSARRDRRLAAALGPSALAV